MNQDRDRATHQREAVAFNTDHAREVFMRQVLHGAFVIAMMVCALWIASPSFAENPDRILERADPPPATVPRAEPSSDGRVISSSRGVSFHDECPRGSLLVGVAGRSGEWIDQVYIACAPVQADRKSLGPTFYGPANGGWGGNTPKQFALQTMQSTVFIMKRR